MSKMTEATKKVVARIPVVRTLAGRLYTKLLAKRFPESETYWIERFAKGGDSGAGSLTNWQTLRAKS